MSKNYTTDLDKIIEQQEALLSSLKNEAKQLDGNRLLEENKALTAKLQVADEKNNRLQNENSALKSQLADTKNALFVKMANEKLSAFSSVQKSIDGIYYREANNLDSRLDSYRRGCEKSINETLGYIDSLSSKEYDEIKARLNELKIELDKKNAAVYELERRELKNLKAHNDNIGRKLKEEPITENEYRTAAKQKSLESFIGLNILSKAGILLFLVGIIMLGRYAYVHMSDAFKAGLIYLLGFILVGAGEMFYKKEKDIFSTVLISGGVSVLYAATATGYFAFSLYSQKVTFIICILVTAFAIALSHQTKSQTVCTFAAVGGYLPVIAIFQMGNAKAAVDTSFLPVSAVYFCLLASVILVMTYNKKWYVSQYVGYALHILSVASIGSAAWALKGVGGYEFALPLAAGYAAVSFLIYLMMPALKILRAKEITFYDVLLLTLDTLSGAISVAITIHNCFERSVANRADGFVFLVFTVIYAVLAVKSHRLNTYKGSSSELRNSLFAVTLFSAFAFSVLIVPYVFGVAYGPMAWAVEAAVICVLSTVKGISLGVYTGTFALGVSGLGALIQYNLDKVEMNNSIITFSILIISLWLITVLGLSNEKKNFFYVVVECITAFCTFFYLRFMYKCILFGPLVNSYSREANICVYIVFVLVIAFVLKLGVLKNEYSAFLSDVSGIVLVLYTLISLDINCTDLAFHNMFSSVIEEKEMNPFLVGLLVVINIIVNLNFASSVGSLLNRYSAAMWIYTASLSASSLALITAVLMSPFGVKFSSVIISAVYIFAACIILFVGFKKRYTVVRSGGLVIILVAIAKLCFVDTAALDSAWKIASYFAFGALLIVISYFYRRFSKKLEQQALEDSQK